jgi:hypothetical protein
MLLPLCINCRRQENQAYVNTQFSKILTVLYVLTVYWKKVHAFFGACSYWIQLPLPHSSEKKGDLDFPLYCTAESRIFSSNPRRTHSGKKDKEKEE